MDKHTPTPWISEPIQYDAYDAAIRIPDPLTGKSNGQGTIAHLMGPKAVENAAYIVRAVNAHEDLVRGNAALRESKEELININDKLVSILKGIIEATGKVIGGQEYGFVIHKNDATYQNISQAIAKGQVTP